MATRDRTGLYLSFRAACDHQVSRRPSGYVRDQEEDREGLLAGTDDVAIEMDRLPPRWVDITDEVDDLLRKINALTKILDPLHKKHALPGFEDRTAEERKIEQITSQITAHFHKCSSLLKKVDKESKDGRDVDRIICRNVTQAVAGKVSVENGKFRQSQSAYLARLRKRPTMSRSLTSENPPRNVDPDLESGQQAQATTQKMRGGRYDTEINRREQEVDEIARSIAEVADIFKELNTMVIDQGTLLDRIDYNIDNMHVNMQAASKELVKAENYQVRTRKRKLMLLLVLLIIAAILILIYKPIARSYSPAGAVGGHASTPLPVTGSDSSEATGIVVSPIINAAGSRS